MPVFVLTSMKGELITVGERVQTGASWLLVPCSVSGELCRWSTLPRKFSTTKVFSATSLMRTIALLGDRVSDPLHNNREKIEISPVFMEILGFKTW